MHRHEEAEAFFILDGAFEINANGRSRVYHQSEFAYVSSSLTHSFRNVSTAPGRRLIITVPAGLHEGFFADAGDIVEPGTTQFPPMVPPDLVRLQAAAARARMELLPPDSQG